MRYVNIALGVILAVLIAIWMARPIGDSPLRSASLLSRKHQNAPGKGKTEPSATDLTSPTGTSKSRIPSGESFASDANEEDRKREFVESSNEAKQLRVSRDKIAAFVAYARLFAQLNLSANDQERFVGLVLDKQYIPQDMNDALTERLIVPKGGEFRRMAKDGFSDLKRVIEDEIQALLGPDKYGAYRNYEERLPANLVTTELQQLCAIAGAPLSHQKAMELVEVFASNPVAPSEQHGVVVPVANEKMALFHTDKADLLMLASGAWFVDLNGTLTVNYPVSEAANLQAMRVLSPDQYVALNALREKQSAQRTLADKF